MSHRQRGHLETPPPFTVPCERVKLGFYTVPTENLTLGRHVAVHYTTAAPRQLHSVPLKVYEKESEGPQSVHIVQKDECFSSIVSIPEHDRPRSFFLA